MQLQRKVELATRIRINILGRKTVVKRFYRNEPDIIG